MGLHWKIELLGGRGSWNTIVQGGGGFWGEVDTPMHTMRTSTMLDEIASKTVYKDTEGDW